MKPEKQKKIVFIIFGTRPELIKLAPLYLALKESNEFSPKLIYTDQHSNQIDSFLDVFSIKPDYNLGLFELGKSLQKMQGEMLLKLDDIYQKDRPDMVVVQGDTLSTFVGALSAFLQKIPVIHLEAGLRTDEIYSPFPEEMFRRMVSRMSSCHLCPTNYSLNNLKKENITQNIYNVGNTVIDSLKFVKDKFEFKIKPLNERKKVLITTHRRENWGEGMDSIFEAINYLCSKYTEFEFIFPVHMNPKIKEHANLKLSKFTNLKLIEPQGYVEFIKLMSESRIILSDSGGVQEEAPYFDTPVLVMRETTERIEGVHAKKSILVGTSKDKIIEAFKDCMENETLQKEMLELPNPYGDGSACPQIIEILSKIKF